MVIGDISGQVTPSTIHFRSLLCTLHGKKNINMLLLQIVSAYWKDTQIRYKNKFRRHVYVSYTGERNDVMEEQ